MKHNIRGASQKIATLGLALSLSAIPIAGHATVYNFVQETASSPDADTVIASFTVNGTLDDIPTISDSPMYPTPPNGYDFGNLQAFNIDFPTGWGVNLNGDFTGILSEGEPLWSISPNGISYEGFYVDFNMGLDPATGDAFIHFLTDGGGNVCAITYDGGCNVTGQFVLDGPITYTQVPEPGSLILLATGLFGVATIRRRRIV